MARIRITISLDTDSTSDKAVLEFLIGLTEANEVGDHQRDPARRSGKTG